MKRRFFTTTEYLDALTLLTVDCPVHWKGRYNCVDQDFCLFSTKTAAEIDAQWIVDCAKKEREKRKRPEVLEVIFKRAGKRK